MFPPCRSWFGRFSCKSISSRPIRYVNVFTMTTQNNGTPGVTLRVSQASPSSTHSVHGSQRYFCFNRNKHHFSSFTALNLCSALLCFVFFPPVFFFFFLLPLCWKCAWPIGCDGNVRESSQWLLRAGVFVCWFVLPTYHLLSSPWRCVPVSLPECSRCSMVSWQLGIVSFEQEIIQFLRVRSLQSFEREPTSYLTVCTLGSSRRGPSTHESQHNPIMCVLRRGKTWIHIWR